MTRSTLPRGFALLCLAFLMSSCGLFGGDKQGSFTIAVSDAALTLQQSVIDTVTVTVTRSDYSETISLALTGVPAGVSAVFKPSQLGAAESTSLLVLTASGTAAVGPATINVAATGNGVAEQATSFQLTIGVTGSYTLAAHGAPAVAAQGGAGSATVVITRTGGHADNIALSVSGAPSGVTASVTPSSTDGGAATLSISAAAGTVVGTYPLTITGVAAGLANQTKVIDLQVIAAPSTTSMSMAFCPTRIPLWFAIQNQGYAWQTVSPTGATFTFQATDKLAVAYTLSFNDRTEVHTFYVSRAELAGWSDRNCFGPKTLNGSIVGSTSGQSARISMGAAVATPTNASPSFTLNNVADRSLDIVGTKGTFSSLSDGSLLITPDKLLLRRAQNPATNTSLGNLDFGGGEAFVPASNTITLGNTLSGDSFFAVNTFWSATSTYSTLSSAQPVGSFVTHSVPGANLIANDVHELYLDASQPATSTYFTSRSISSYYGAGTDHTETFGAPLGTPITTALTTTPYVRLRGQLDAQADYPTATRFLYVEETSTLDRWIFLWVTSGYQPSGTWDVAIPDFSGVSGFNSVWMLQNVDLIYQVDALSGAGSIIFGTVPVPGQLVKGALRVQFTGLTQAAGQARGARIQGSSALRNPRSAIQYFRR